MGTKDTTADICPVENYPVNHHLLEFEFVDVDGSGSLSFHVATANGTCAWLSRFRIYVPNHSDKEYRYTVKTQTYFSTDYFFLGGFADDFIDDVYLDTFLMWQDWEWDSKNGVEGDVYAWGFMYPLGQVSGWHNMVFTFGEIWATGMLDFQYLSRSWQQGRIGKPEFWSKIYPPSSPSLTIYDGLAWAGSEWDSIPGSKQKFAAGIRILANATDTTTFWPAPQEAEVTLFLDVPGPPWDKNTYQDIGVYVNLTYKYYIEGSILYGLPIWFEPYLISVNVPTQGYMLYVPTPSIVFCNQSTTSFITPEWKITGGALGVVNGAIIGYEIGGWPGAIIGAMTGYLARAFFDYTFADKQILNCTKEFLGPPTSRNYTMNAFKTTKDQVPLSPVVSSVSSAYFFRVSAFSPTYTGGVTVDLHGRLWLPFFYKNPPPGMPDWYGTWLPIDIEICTVFPVFIED